MNIIKFEGKAVEKLIEVVSQAIGTIYKPRAIRNEAEAKAYEIEVLANAEAKKTLIEGDAKNELIERAKTRLVHQEVQRQKNIEEIVEKSFKYLKDEVSKDPVNEDWRTRYFNKSRDVSNDQMQEIWAKILAGEVSKPGQVSFRTLEVISNLTEAEAKKFMIACSIATDNSRIWKLGEETDNFNINELKYEDLLLLREAGLIHDNDDLVAIIKVDPNLRCGFISIGDGNYTITSNFNSNLTEYRLPLIAFTSVGIELCRFIGSKPKADFHDRTITYLTINHYVLNKI